MKSEDDKTERCNDFLLIADPNQILMRIPNALGLAAWRVMDWFDEVKCVRKSTISRLNFDRPAMIRLRLDQRPM